MAWGLPVMLTVDRVIEASSEAVWDVLVDVDAWPRWGPTISGASLDGAGHVLTAGATGVVYTPLAVALPFAITEFDPGRSWAWTVAGVPATRHRVEPLGAGARLTFAVPWWAGPYLTVCAVALRRIENLAQ